MRELLVDVAPTPWTFRHPFVTHATLVCVCIQIPVQTRAVCSLYTDITSRQESTVSVYTLGAAPSSELKALDR